MWRETGTSVHEGQVGLGKVRGLSRGSAQEASIALFKMGPHRQWGSAGLGQRVGGAGFRRPIWGRGHM